MHYLKCAIILAVFSFSVVISAMQQQNSFSEDTLQPNDSYDGDKSSQNSNFILKQEANNEKVNPKSSVSQNAPHKQDLSPSIFEDEQFNYRSNDMEEKFSDHCVQQESQIMFPSINNISDNDSKNKSFPVSPIIRRKSETKFCSTSSIQNILDEFSPNINRQHLQKPDVLLNPVEKFFQQPNFPQNLVPTSDESFDSLEFLTSKLSSYEDANEFLNKFFIKSVDFIHRKDPNFENKLCSLTFEPRPIYAVEFPQVSTPLKLILDVDPQIVCYKAVETLAEITGADRQISKLFQNVADALIIKIFENFLKNCKDLDLIMTVVTLSLSYDKGVLLRMMLSFENEGTFSRDVETIRILPLFLSLSPLSRLFEKATIFFAFARLEVFVSYVELLTPAESPSLVFKHISNLMLILRGMLNDKVYISAYSGNRYAKFLEMVTPLFFEFSANLKALGDKLSMKSGTAVVKDTFLLRSLTTSTAILNLLKGSNTALVSYPAMDKWLILCEELFMQLKTYQNEHMPPLKFAAKFKESISLISLETVLNHLQNLIKYASASSDSVQFGILEGLFEIISIASKTQSFSEKFISFQKLVTEILISVASVEESQIILNALSCGLILFSSVGFFEVPNVVFECKKLLLESFYNSCNQFAKLLSNVPLPAHLKLPRKIVLFRLLLECDRENEAFKSIAHKDAEAHFGALFNNFWIPLNPESDFMRYIVSLGEHNMITLFAAFWKVSNVYADGIYEDFLKYLDNYVFKGNSNKIENYPSSSSKFIDCLHYKSPKSHQFLIDNANNSHSLFKALWDEDEMRPSVFAMDIFGALQTNTLTHRYQLKEQFNFFDVSQDFSF